MKTTMLCAGILAAALATQAGATNYHHGHAHDSHPNGTYHHKGYAHSGQTIIVSCYRGPWREVIWDRPNGKFLDSLVAVGYSQQAAQAIGERICRDRNLVGNLQNMIGEVRRIIRDAPNR